MKLYEITKDVFVARLKDPFMAKVNLKVEQIMSRLGEKWELVIPPTYEDSINDPSIREGGDEAIVFKIRYMRINRNKIKSDVIDAENVINGIFSIDRSWTDLDRDKNGEEICTIKSYVWPHDV